MCIESSRQPTRSLLSRSRLTSFAGFSLMKIRLENNLFGRRHFGERQMVFLWIKTKAEKLQNDERRVMTQMPRIRFCHTHAHRTNHRSPCRCIHACYVFRYTRAHTYSRTQIKIQRIWILLCPVDTCEKTTDAQPEKNMIKMYKVNELNMNRITIRGEHFFFRYFQFTMSCVLRFALGTTTTTTKPCAFFPFQLSHTYRERDSV